MHIAELDKELGYNFLKKVRLGVLHGIFQIFESRKTNEILIISNKGDLLSYNFVNEKLKLLVQNPNNMDITKQFQKIKSAEIFDKGTRLAISMGNGDFLVYQISFRESEIEMMVGPYSKESREGKARKYLKKRIFPKNESNLWGNEPLAFCLG